MVFSSIQKINRLLKEINRLLSRGMSNIYFKVIIEKKLGTHNFDFLSLESLSSGQFLGSSNLTQISLSFQTSCCYLKVRRLGEKLCVGFLLFSF